MAPSVVQEQAKAMRQALQGATTPTTPVGGGPPQQCTPTIGVQQGPSTPLTPGLVTYPHPPCILYNKITYLYI